MDDYGASALMARVRGKTKRALLRAPIVSQLSEYRYHALLGRHADNLPWLNRESFELVAELRANGVAVRDASAFMPADVIAVADRFASSLHDSSTNKRSTHISPRELAADPELYKWGMNDENLDLAEFYIGLPVHYLGVAAKREKADGVAADTRQWHMDPEDRRMLKIIVYLNDVDDGCGPFAYVDRRWSVGAKRALRYSSGFVSDAAMARQVSDENWIRVTGPRLSAVFVDTASVFHRASPPTTNDRYSVTFSYASTIPFQTFPEALLSAAALADLHETLTPRQRRAALAK